MTKQQSEKITAHLKTMIPATGTPGLRIYYAVFPMFSDTGELREKGTRPRAVVKDSDEVKLPRSVRDAIGACCREDSFESEIHGGTISHTNDEFDASTPVVAEWVAQCKRLAERLDKVEKVYAAHLSSLDEAAKFADGL